MSRGKRFSQEELEYIKVHSLDMSISEIATALGRNYWAVQRILQNNQAAQLSDEQIEFIRTHKDDKTAQEIARELGISYWAVHGVISNRINSKKNHVFTPNEDFVIRQMYGKYRISLIATRLGVDENSIYNRAKKLGIKKNRKKEGGEQ